MYARKLLPYLHAGRFATFVRLFAVFDPVKYFRTVSKIPLGRGVLKAIQKRSKSNLKFRLLNERRRRGRTMMTDSFANRMINFNLLAESLSLRATKRISSRANRIYPACNWSERRERISRRSQTGRREEKEGKKESSRVLDRFEV